MKPPLRVGLLVPDLGDNQFADMIRLAGPPRGVDLIAFFQDVATAHGRLPIASMDVTEAYDYPGVAVATTLDTARSLLRCPGPGLRYFWAWDLEWIRGRGWSFEEFRDCYANPRMPLLARSRSHRDAIEDAWNTRARAVVDDIDGLIRVINEDLSRKTGG